MSQAVVLSQHLPAVQRIHAEIERYKRTHGGELPAFIDLTIAEELDLERGIGVPETIAAQLFVNGARSLHTIYGVEIRWGRDRLNAHTPRQ